MAGRDGISVSGAVRMPLLRVATEKSLLFDVSAPNATTVRAMRAAGKGQGKRPASAGALFNLNPAAAAPRSGCRHAAATTYRIGRYHPEGEMRSSRRSLWQTPNGAGRPLNCRIQVQGSGNSIRGGTMLKARSFFAM
jgi:hypothetical protein